MAGNKTAGKNRVGHSWSPEEATAARAKAATAPECSREGCRRKVGVRGDRTAIICALHKREGAAPPPVVEPAPSRAKVTPGTKRAPPVAKPPPTEAPAPPKGGSMRAKAASGLRRALTTSISGRAVED